MKIILFVLLLTGSAFAQKEWQLLEVSTTAKGAIETTFEVKPSSITTVRQGVFQAWIRVTDSPKLKKPPVDYQMQLIEFGCKLKTMRHIRHVSYNKAGKMVDEFQFSDDEKAAVVTPDSIAESVLEGVCEITAKPFRVFSFASRP